MFEKKERLYKVVFNSKKQYSVWPAYKKIPGGWLEDGFIGNEEECIEYMQKTWIDVTNKYES